MWVHNVKRAHGRFVGADRRYVVTHGSALLSNAAAKTENSSCTTRAVHIRASARLRLVLPRFARLLPDRFLPVGPGTPAHDRTHIVQRLRTIQCLRVLLDQCG